MAEEAPKEIRVDRKHRKIGNIAPELADRCYTCGTCAGGCPATGLVPGWDSRKAIRAIVFGMEQEVIDSKWPWVCTLCGRCQYRPGAGNSARLAGSGRRNSPRRGLHRFVVRAPGSGPLALGHWIGIPRLVR